MATVEAKHDLLAKPGLGLPPLLQRVCTMLRVRVIGRFGVDVFHFLLEGVLQLSPLEKAVFVVVPSKPASQHES